ncbi:MAG: hypothetical protein BWY25_02903 [Chloroflexi bacterium ADurb.Bin222]|nr:MAG: hypothetical protein BWY25_02903 [Chloroflexi bacterium ADurb.Bin222]
MSAKLQGFDVGEQRFVKEVLLGGKRVVQELIGDVEAGAVIEEPGGGAQVAGGARGVSEVAGVLVDAGEHERRLDAADGDEAGGERFDHQRGVGAERLAAEGPAGGQRLGRRVMIHYQHFLQVGSHAAHGGEALRVHENGALNASSARQLLRGDEGELCPIQAEERLDVAVDAARQHGQRGGEELVRSRQAGDGVKIGVLVGQNDLHGVVLNVQRRRRRSWQVGEPAFPARPRARSPDLRRSRRRHRAAQRSHRRVPRTTPR